MRDWFLSLTALLVLCSASRLSAQTVQYPPDFPKPPLTSADAYGWFEARAAAVVAFSACAREVEYLTIRERMAGGDYSRQGEDLTSILIAKLAWLHSRTDPCTASIKVDAGDFHGIWERSASTTRCAVETKRSSDALPPILTVTVSPVCLRRQINESIMAMVKDSRMGSSDLPCIQTFRGASVGEWDVNVRELVRILYMAGSTRNRGPSLLDEETVDHMYEHLLAARGALGPPSYSVVAGCEDAGEELGSPEDTADRQRWYNELLDSITDFFKWFFDLNFKLAVATIGAATAPAAAPFLLMAGEDPTKVILPIFDVRIPETENHRLMIETSRYLTNADIIARLESKGYDSDLVDDIKEDQDEVRVWLLQRLQDITKNDFIEYNARPYTRYSLEAILNLYDFADVHGDRPMRVAAGIVLDLSVAKFAIGSNRGRRLAPFRRRSGNDGSDPGPNQDLYNYASGGDHEVARALLLGGQTQLLPYGWLAEKGGVGVLVNTAVSTYRVPQPVREVMVELDSPLFQHVAHTSVEAYFRAPAFTISAGGLRAPPAYSVLGKSTSEAYGAAMPTVIIPTLAGAAMPDLFGFAGVGTHENRTENLCVWFGFVCGMNPQMSQIFSNCESNRSAVGATTTVFVNSAACFPFASDVQFFLAARFVDCDGAFCTRGRTWGLMEIVAAPDPDLGNAAAKAARDALYATFRAGRQAAFNSAMPDGAGQGVYVTAAGDSISYVLNEAQPIVTAVNGTTQSYDATAGDVIKANRLGLATITAPSGATVELDFSDWTNPKRTP